MLLNFYSNEDTTSLFHTIQLAYLSILLLKSEFPALFSTVNSQSSYLVLKS